MTGKEPKLPLIFAVDRKQTSQAEASSIFDYVLKQPFSQTALFDAINALVVKQPAGALHTVESTDSKSVEQQPAPSSGLRILVAEDNVVNQRVVLAYLNKLGHQADVVTNGLEALQSVQAFPYELILMDVQMPEMDGLEALVPFVTCPATRPTSLSLP